MVTSGKKKTRQTYKKMENTCAEDIEGKRFTRKRLEWYPVVEADD